jgi:hypothetical protein
MLAAMAKRPHGTGHLYEKHGAWYGRWRTPAGRRLNRKVGPVRLGERGGLTGAQAEREFRRLQGEEERRPTPAKGQEQHTPDEAADLLRRQLALEGAHKSYGELRVDVAHAPDAAARRAPAVAHQHRRRGGVGRRNARARARGDRSSCARVQVSPSAGESRSPLGAPSVGSWRRRSLVTPIS